MERVVDNDTGSDCSCNGCLCYDYICRDSPYNFQEMEYTQNKNTKEEYNE